MTVPVFDEQLLPHTREDLVQLGKENHPLRDRDIFERISYDEWYVLMCASYVWRKTKSALEPVA